MSKVIKYKNLLMVKDVAIPDRDLPFDERWKFNGDYEKPTFRPSMVADYGEAGKTHCFVTDGKIEYLSDCSHEYAGKTVDCIDYEPDEF